MKASLKSAKFRIRGIQQFKSKISTLQTQYQKLLIQRQHDIASLISAVDLADVDDQILLGGFLFLKEKIITKDSIMEEWQSAGERFLRRIKPKKQSTSKPIASSSTTHQSSQKQS